MSDRTVFTKYIPQCLTSVTANGQLKKSVLEKMRDAKTNMLQKRNVCSFLFFFYFTK